LFISPLTVGPDLIVRASTRFFVITSSTRQKIIKYTV
jgi:hypothetical protein